MLQTIPSIRFVGLTPRSGFEGYSSNGLKINRKAKFPFERANPNPRSGVEACSERVQIADAQRAEDTEMKLVMFTRIGMFTER